MTAARQFREMSSLPFIEIELAAGSLGVLVRLGGLKMTADRAIESGTFVTVRNSILALFLVGCVDF